MKRLFVLRHAKSSWDDSSLSDFDRPLNDRGLRAAPFMGKFMATKLFNPDVIVSSPAERARQTAELARKAGNFDAPLTFEKRIYEASVQELAEVISEIPQHYRAVLLVGHNPAMEGILRHLTGELCSMPTAALAVITLQLEKWPDIAAQCGTLDALFRPKEEMKRPLPDIT